MKMKYIIELEDRPFYKSNGMSEPLYRVKGFNSLVFDENGLSKLTPYDKRAIEHDAYENGKKNGYLDGFKDAEQAAYQRGYENGFAEGRTRKEMSDEKDDEIRVGDEVIVNGLTGVVMRLDEKGNVDRYFTSDGKTFGNISGFQNNEVIKTGRYFPAVEKLLEAMQ